MGDPALDRVPHWSPDGNWISCFSNRSGKLQIWKIRPDGSDLQQITDVAEEVAYSAWSPDASRLAVTTAGISKRLVSFVVDSSRRSSEQQAEPLPPLPDAKYPLTPNSWSPDGQRLIGFAGPSASPSTGIVVYTFKTGRMSARPISANGRCGCRTAGACCSATAGSTSGCWILKRRRRRQSIQAAATCSVRLASHRTVARRTIRGV